MAYGIEEIRPFQHTDEQCIFRRFQIRRRFAEICLGSGFDTVCIASEEGDIQIHFQNFILREIPFESYRSDKFTDFSCNFIVPSFMPRLKFVQIAGQLLRYGTGSRLPECDDIQHHLPDKPGKINPPVRVKILVFCGN